MIYIWIDDYLALLFPPESKDLQIEEAQTLKYRHIPNALYRYRQFNDYTIENLRNEQEWQSYPCEFNDPSDSRLQVNIETIKNELFFEKLLNDYLEKGLFFTAQELDDIRSSNDPYNKFAHYVARLDPALKGKEENLSKALSEIVEKHLKEIYKPFLTAFQSGYLVVCFSEVKDSNLMWSHYADCHTGFCIEYNFKELGPHSAQTRMLAPVIYSDCLFDATKYLVDPIIKGCNYNNLFGNYPCISKGADWSYEREWRTIFPLGPNADKQYRLLKVPTPKALYVGTKATTKNIDRIKEIAISKKISLYQMNLADDSLRLNQQLVLP